MFTCMCVEVHIMWEGGHTQVVVSPKTNLRGCCCLDTVHLVFPDMVSHWPGAYKVG